MKKIGLVKTLVLITGLFILSACNAQNNIESEQTEVNHAEKESIEEAMEDDTEENEIEVKGEVTENEEEKVEKMTPRESLDYMFDYLYPDKSNMTEIVLTDTEDELSYTFKFININSETNETSTSDPRGLFLKSSTKDGLYHNFALYEEIWGTIWEEDGAHKVFSHISYFNNWYVNTETKEIIPRKIFNEEAEEDEDYFIFNEKYDEIIEKYSTYEGD